MSDTSTSGKRRPAWLVWIAGIGGGIVGAIAVNLLLSGGKSFTSGSTPISDQIDQAMLSTRTGSTLKERFPQDYRDAISKMAALSEDKSLKPTEIQQEAAKITAAIRVKYSEFAGRAPDMSLQKVIEAQAGLLKYIRDERGASACSRMANEGPTAFIPIPPGLSAQFDLAGGAMITAIAEGRRQPTSRPAASQADFDTMIEGIRKKGVTDDEIDAVQDKALDDSDCGVVIAMFETVAAMPAGVGERLRSYVVDSIAMTP
ncbi:MAG: hypothetical protein QM773_10110 [Hyphomonadaceae bacterium]